MSADPQDTAASDNDRDYDLRIREAALRLTIERARDVNSIDIDRCFRWFERLLRTGR